MDATYKQIKEECGEVVGEGNVARLTLLPCACAWNNLYYHEILVILVKSDKKCC